MEFSLEYIYIYRRWMEEYHRENIREYSMLFLLMFVSEKTTFSSLIRDRKDNQKEKKQLEETIVNIDDSSYGGVFLRLISFFFYLIFSKRKSSRRFSH
jgi:hypothetical protein